MPTFVTFSPGLPNNAPHGAPGVLLLQMVPQAVAWLRCYHAPQQKGTIFQKSPPRGTVLQKRFETVPFFKKGYYIGTPRGTVSRKKRSKTVPLFLTGALLTK